MENLEIKTMVELRILAKQKGLKNYSKLVKSELINLIKKGDQIDDSIRFIKIKQLGKKGKEGTVFLVIDSKDGKKYAMKTFKTRKSSKTLTTEAEFQIEAYKAGVAPKVILYSPEGKFIVMDLMERTLMQIIEDQKGHLTENQQKQIIDLYRKLDKIGIVHNDANPLNIMEKKGRLYLIDYGFTKLSSHKNFKKYNEPNFQLMPLGLLLWLKGKVSTSSWKYLRSQIDTKIYESLKVNEWP